jgi:hypothetical protein
MMNGPTVARFVLWALDKGYLGRPELVPEFLGLLSRAAAEHPRRHDLQP